MRKFIVVLVLLLSACAMSTEDRLAASYTVINQTAASTESLYRQKLISKEKGTKVFETLQSSLTLLDTARDLHYLGKDKEAENQLKEAQAKKEEAKKQLKGGPSGAGT